MLLLWVFMNCFVTVSKVCFIRNEFSNAARNHIIAMTDPVQKAAGGIALSKRRKAMAKAVPKFTSVATKQSQASFEIIAKLTRRSKERIDWYLAGEAEVARVYISTSF